MAKKPTRGRPTIVNTTTEELKAVRLELPVDIHRELRVEAAKNDTNMSALARVAVEEFLARRKAGKK